MIKVIRAISRRIVRRRCGEAGKQVEERDQDLAHSPPGTRAGVFACAGLRPRRDVVSPGRSGALGIFCILLHRARAGEYFAEAAVDCPTYLCDATAFQASTLAVIPKNQLGTLIRNDRDFAMQWNAVLTRELRVARERIERLALSSVAERVRHFILSEGRDTSLEVALPGSLKDLARDLGVSHEALYRTLAKMEQAGEVHRKGNSLRLATPQRAKRRPPPRR
jgi:hypothetical protein